MPPAERKGPAAGAGGEPEVGARAAAWTEVAAEEGPGAAEESPSQHRAVSVDRFSSDPGPNLAGMHLLAQAGVLLDQLPGEVKEKAEQVLEQVRANPTLMWILVGVGALTALVFVIGVIKHAFKAAILAALLSVGAWYWYFNIR